MESQSPLAARIAEAYRWRRRLGAETIDAPFCRIVADPARPQVWDRNHADDVSAEAPQAIDAVLAAMDTRLAHTRWRVVHTDASTPDAFLARLAFDDYRERPVEIMMALEAALVGAGARPDLSIVESEADWAALGELALINHREGLTSGGLDISAETTAAIVEGYRSQSPACRFYLVREAGAAIAYGASAVAPNGLGVIEDLFTRPDRRRRGVASGMIAAFVDALRADGCDAIFLSALAEAEAKRLYRRLGFRPVALARAWVRDAGGSQDR